MLMRLLKTILITSNLFVINLYANDINSSKVKIISNDNNFNQNLLQIKSQIKSNNISLLKQKELISQLMNQIKLQNQNISKLQNQNILYKKALVKMILDINKIKIKNEHIYVVTANVINERQCPDKNCPIIRNALKGDLIIIKKLQNDWYETRTGDYIYKTLLRKAF